MWETSLRMCLVNSLLLCVILRDQYRRHLALWALFFVLFPLRHVRRTDHDVVLTSTPIAQFGLSSNRCGPLDDMTW